MPTPTDEDTDATRTTTEAPRALADGDTVEVDHGGVGLEAPESATEPAEATELAQEATPEARPEPREQPREDRRGRGNLGVALREEREARKRDRAEAAKWKRVAEQATKGGVPAEPGVKFTWPTSGLSAQERQQIIEGARQATDFGQPTEQILGAVERLMTERERRMQEHLSTQVEQALRVREVVRMEREFIRDGHEDYRETTQRAGIFDLTWIDPQTGKPGPRFNREVAEAIGRSDNPIEAAYWIAKNILGEADDHPDGADPRPEPSSSPSRTPNPPRREAPAPPPSAADLAEAERRGAREVAARVADNGARPRGVRTLTPAGAPQQVKLDEAYRTYLDGQWDKNPFAVMSLFEKNPGIRDWYEGRR